MPARAILDLPEIPESCSDCPYQKQKDIYKRNVFYCEIEEDCYSTYEHEYSRHKNCPLRKVPECTEEDSKFINLWLNNVKCLQEKLGNKEIMALRTLKKLCKLAQANSVGGQEGKK